MNTKKKERAVQGRAQLFYLIPKHETGDQDSKRKYEDKDSSLKRILERIQLKEEQIELRNSNKNSVIDLKPAHKEFIAEKECELPNYGLDSCKKKQRIETPCVPNEECKVKLNSIQRGYETKNYKGSDRIPQTNLVQEQGARPKYVKKAKQQCNLLSRIIIKGRYLSPDDVSGWYIENQNLNHLPRNCLGTLIAYSTDEIAIAKKETYCLGILLYLHPYSTVIAPILSTDFDQYHTSDEVVTVNFMEKKNKVEHYLPEQS